MPLQNIAEDNIEDSFNTIDLNTGTRPLGYRTIYGTPSDDNLSISTYSTNATAPNLPGTGRVLGNFYDSSGKRLERALGDIARKAGFGPEAVYEKICVLSQGDWTKDDKQASLLQRHCLKLFEHASSVVDLTRFQAIKRWGDILQDHHEIYVWLFCKRRIDVLASVDKLIRNVEILQEAVDSPSDLDILDRTASLIDCHSVGLKLISLSRGTILVVGRLFEVEWQGLRKFSTEDVEKWDILFQYLLEKTLNTSLSGVSQWYIQLWSTQIENGKLHAHNALQLCQFLRSMLAVRENFNTVRSRTLQSLCEKTYAYLSQLLDFGSPLRLTEGIEYELTDGVHNPTAITTLNDLVRSYNTVIPKSSLLLLSVCHLKEKIEPLLKNPQAGNGLQTEESETILVRILNRLLDHALFEVKDTNYITELHHRITSDDDSTRSSALFQLGDILQSIPEVYELMITLGEHETMDRVLEISKSLEKSQLSKSKCGIFTDLHPILKCHTLAYEFRRVLIPIRGKSHMEGESDQVEWKDSLNYPSSEIERWGVSFQYLLESLLNPAISHISQRYLSFWSSQLIEGTPYVRNVLLCCRSLQNALGLVDISQVSRCDALQSLCKAVYTNLVRRFESDILQLDEGAQISSTLNGLTQLHDRVFSPKLGSVPNLACLTILGSIDLISADIKEEIRGLLRGLEDDDDEVQKIRETMFLRSFKKLLKRAQTELYDANCLNELSKATRYHSIKYSFTDGTSIRAISQLKDILQSLPEVYMLSITLGGDEMRDSVDALHNLKCNFTCYTLEDLQRLLACHSAGMWLASEDMSDVWSSEVNKFIAQTVPFDNRNFHEVRDRFLLYLTDNLTAIPLNFYLNYGRANYDCYHKQTFLPCCIVQGALLRNRWSVSQENRSAMEELCRSMQSSIIERLRWPVEYLNGDFTELGHAMQSVCTDLTESKQAFADEAEVYLLQLCNTCFEVIMKAGNKSLRCCAIKGLSNLFESRNVFGWFLSIRGPDTEESISRLLEDLDDSQVFDPKEVWFYRRIFSHLEVHKLGVDLLAPRHEKLHFEGAGLTKHLPTRSSEPPLTRQQRERWINAFKTLAANLRSSVSNLINISLFYFANCPLPFETDPMLDTAIALDYCANLHHFISESIWIEERRPVSRAVCHIHTCLSKRVKFVQQSCTDLAPDESPTFCGTPFDTSKVVKILNELAKSSKERLGSDALKLLTIPNY